MTTCLPSTLLPEAELEDLLVRNGGGALPIGPGFEVAVVPALLARAAINLIGGLSVDLVGAVAVLEDGWAFFLPEESYEPGWPDQTRYLSYGSTIALPPPPDSPATDGARWHWRGLGSRVYTAPLLLQLALNAVGESAAEGDVE